MSTIDLRCGRWQDTMADVECGALICDPPYSARTHAGSDAVADRTRDGSDRQTLAYAWWTADDVAEFVAAWAPRTRSWMCAMTDSTLIPAWTHAYTMADRYAFAPVPILQHRPRISGDGPASCAVYLMVSRPRQKRFAQWGSLPGWYLSRPEHAVGVQGAKPSDLMRAIIRDYSRPGDMICDPCAGGATTLIAAQIEGRDSIGSEMDPKTHARAMRRIQYGRHAAKADDQPCFDFDRRP